MFKSFAVELVFFGFILFLLVSGADIFKSQVLNPDYLFSRGSTVTQEVYTRIFNNEVFNLYKNFLMFISLFFITIICYCAVRLLEIRKKEHANHYHEIHEYAKRQKEREQKSAKSSMASQNPRWNQVLTYLMSDSSSDWKLAIIEADSMLEILLTDLGFKGTTLGDRPKMASKDTFTGLSFAWEVHAIRNKIAHEGMNFDLSHHEAKRVVALYEQIFRNYGFI